MTAAVVAATIPSDARATVLAGYRVHRQLVPPRRAAEQERDGWALQIARDALRGGTVSSFAADCFRAADTLVNLIDARKRYDVPRQDAAATALWWRDAVARCERLGTS